MYGTGNSTAKAKMLGYLITGIAMATSHSKV